MSGSTSVRITERDQDILDHIVRHRITTREAVQRLFLDDHELNAATKVLRRLVRADYLADGVLPDGQTKYWRLSQSYARAKGLHPYNAKPLNFGPAIEHFGVLAFCCLGATRRHLFTREEFRGRYPDHHDERLLRSHYYLDTDKHGVERLGLILIDSGRRDEMRWIRRFRQLYQRRLSLAGFRKRLRDPDMRFLLAVVVPTVGKKTALVRSIAQAEQEGDRWPIMFRIEVEPRLERMMVPYAP